MLVLPKGCGGHTYAEGLEEVLGLGIDIKLSALGVLGEVEGRHFGDVLILALSLLFLELERDTTDGTTLNALHEMGGVTSNLFHLALECANRLVMQKSYLVAKTLGGNDGNLIADSLVGLKIESQLGVVSLNDDLGGLLNGLSTNATHDCGLSNLSEE